MRTQSMPMAGTARTGVATWSAGASPVICGAVGTDCGTAANAGMVCGATAGVLTTIR